MMKRTPPSSNKRKLADDFDESMSGSMSKPHNEENETSKKLNLSQSDSDPVNLSQSSNFERNMFAAQLKQEMLNANTLTLDLKHAMDEKEDLAFQLCQLKKKHAAELSDIAETTQILEDSLKSAKSNEKLLKSEIDRIHVQADSLSGVDLPEKEKEIKALKTEIENLLEEKSESNLKYQKEIDNFKYELESKNSQLEQFKVEITTTNGTIQETYKKLNAVNKENCDLRNQNQDLKLQLSNLQNNSEELSKFIDQSKQVETLEREKRTMASELEFLQLNQEKNLLLKEELESKVKQIERYEAKIVEAEMENNKLANEMTKLSQTKPEVSSTTLVNYKQRIKELDTEVINIRQNYDQANETVRSIKKTLSEKNSYIDQMHNKIALLNTERNCFKKMVEDFDTGSSDPSGQLEKRIYEYETIIAHLKKIHPDLEIKLPNDTSIHLEEDIEGLTTPASSQDSVNGNSDNQSQNSSNDLMAPNSKPPKAKQTSKKATSKVEKVATKKGASKVVRTASKKGTKKTIDEEVLDTELPDIPAPPSKFVETQNEIVPEPEAVANVDVAENDSKPKKTREKKIPAKKMLNEETFDSEEQPPKLVETKQPEDRNEILLEPVADLDLEENKPVPTVKKPRAKKEVKPKKMLDEVQKNEVEDVDHCNPAVVTLKRTRSQKATVKPDLLSVPGDVQPIDTPPYLAYSYTNSLKKKRTKTTNPKEACGTKDLAMDLKEVMDEEDECVYATENDPETEEADAEDDIDLNIPLKIVGRITTAKQIEHIRLERQRLVRLKLQQVAGEKDEIEVDESRKRLVKFAGTSTEIDLVEDGCAVAVEEIVVVEKKVGRGKKTVNPLDENVVEEKVGRGKKTVVPLNENVVEEKVVKKKRVTKTKVTDL